MCLSAYTSLPLEAVFGSSNLCHFFLHAQHSTIRPNPTLYTCTDSLGSQLTMCSKDVHARLNYCQEEQQVLPSKPTTRNSPTKPGPLETIQDVREAHEEFDLELHGFRYVKAPTDFNNWDSELEIRNVLIPEMEVLLRQELRGCDEIHVVGIKVLIGSSIPRKTALINF